jgi:hypothetical protein
MAFPPVVAVCGACSAGRDSERAGGWPQPQLARLGASGAVAFLYFWFAIFVITSKERGWFPSRRRLVHAVAFGAWSTASALLIYAPVSALPVVFLVSLPLGCFAASWVGWLSRERSNKPLERAGLNASSPVEAAGAGRSAPMRWTASGPNLTRC